jgi:polyhydroxybutyrate depolymerase
VRCNGLDPEPSREPVPCTDEGIGIERIAWGEGSAGEVILYELTGGGHTWPGRVPESFYLGPSALSFDANPLIAAFFDRHPRP